MDRFAQFAFSTALRDASFVALAAVTLMVGFSFNPPLALVVGAHAALIFSLLLLYRVTVLTDERVKRTEPWRVLEPHERPRGDFALAIAHDPGWRRSCSAFPRPPRAWPAPFSRCRSGPR